MSSKPTFAFVPGAFHTPAHFQPLVDALAAAGYEGVGIPLPIVGAGAGKCVSSDDAGAIREVLKELVVEKHKEVILVCHSYGGVPGSEAIRGLEKSAVQHGGVVGYVGICAFMCREGETMAEGYARTGFVPGLDWYEVDESGTVIRPTYKVKGVFYSDLGEASREKWFAELRQMSNVDITHKVSNTCWNVDIPKLYIHGKRDASFSFDAQKQLVDHVKDDTWSVAEIDSGHSPFLSHVDECVAILKGFAG